MAEGGPVYSVDLAVAACRPKVELRGKVYQLADLKPGEEEAALLELAQAEKEIVAASEKLATVGDEERRSLEKELKHASAKAVGSVVRRVLKGVPKQVAEGLTVLEYKALMATIGAIGALQPEPVKKNEPAPPS